MNSYSIRKLADAMGGELLSGEDNLLMEAGVSTDTRNLSPGALFFALTGENFDAHDFLNEAASAGAGGVVVQRLPDERMDLGDCALIKVDDTLMALQKLARWYRGELDVVVIGITS